MRTLLIIFLAAGLFGQGVRIPGPGGASAVTPLSLLTSQKASSGSGGSGNTPALDSTGASLIVLGCSSYAGTTAPTPSDSQSNSWTGTTESRSTSNARIILYYKYAPTTSASHTFACTGTNSFAGAVVLVYTGGVGSGFDQQAGNFADSGTTCSPGSVTATTNGQVYIAGLANDGGVGPYSVNSSFTIQQQISFAGGATMGIALADLIVDPAAAKNPQFSLTSAGGEIACKIATFK